MKLSIRDEKQFRQAYHFAKKLGGESKRSFRNCLRTLNRIRHNTEKRMPDLSWEFNISPDWVPQSFYWELGYRQHDGAYRQNYNGAMILHGFGETLSVELNPSTFPKWSIHT